METDQLTAGRRLCLGWHVDNTDEGYMSMRLFSGHETNLPDQPGGGQKAIDLTGLTARMAELQTSIKTLAKQFTGDNIWALFESLARRANRAWTEFEEQHSWLAEEGTALQAEVQGFSTSATVAKFRDDVAEAKGQLETDFEKAVRDRELLSRQRRELDSQLADAEDELRTQTIEMAGYDVAPIKHVNKWYELIRAVTLFILLGIVESFAGFDIFRFEGSSALALGASVLTIIYLTGTSHFGASSMAKILEHMHAARHFRTRYPDGEDEDGNKVHLLPLSPMTQIVAWVSTCLCFAGAFGLVAWRLHAASKDAYLGGTAMYVTVAIAAITVAYYLVELKLAPKYDSDLQETWEGLDANVASLAADLEELGKVPAEDGEMVDAYPVARQRAVSKYRSSLEAARKVAAESTAVLPKRIASFLAQLSRYSGAHTTCRKGYLGAVNALLRTVKASHGDLDWSSLNVNDHATVARVEEMFDRKAIPAIDAAALESVLKAFKPEVVLPEDISQISVGDLEQAIQQRVRESLSHADAPVEGRRKVRGSDTVFDFEQRERE